MLLPWPGRGVNDAVVRFVDNAHDRACHRPGGDQGVGLPLSLGVRQGLEQDERWGKAEGDIPLPRRQEDLS